MRSVPDGQTLAIGDSGGIRLWNISDKPYKVRWETHTPAISFAYSPDGKTLASGKENGTVILWNAISGEERATLTGHMDPVSNVAFSPDGKTLASTGRYKDKTIRFSDVATASHLLTKFTGHTDYISSIAFSADGTILASASDDGTILLWEYPLLQRTLGAPTLFTKDVNRDGVLNIKDLSFIAAHFGHSGKNQTDVDGNGVVNIADLLLVADTLRHDLDISSLDSEALASLTAKDIRQWLWQAQASVLTDAVSQRGIQTLTHLLALLAPKETTVMQNYPNPFNPETWIPYQLATPTDVTLTIYAADGKRVRTLELGHQPAGIYYDQSRAAYWDGKNQLGEPVASGLYFYTLTVENFIATRKMLIMK